MLTIRPDQIGALVGQRAEARRRRTIKYLREVTHPELQTATDEQVRRHVLHSEVTGRELGLATEAGHYRWAYLVYATRGRIVHHPEIAEIITHRDRTPDQQVEGLMEATIDGLKKSASLRQV